MQVVHKGEIKLFRQSRLSNRFVLTTDAEHVCFQDRVEVEIQNNRCKVFSISPPSSVGAHIRSMQMTRQKNLTVWLANRQKISQLLYSNKCIAVVDGSFFPEHPECI